MIYFDNAASTPMYPEVIESMTRLMKDVFGNPSSIHAFGRNARVAIEDARSLIAQLCNVAPSEIIFTSCATEANNWVINKFIENYAVNHVVTTLIEHPSVLKPLRELASKSIIKITYLELNNKGHFELSKLEDILSNEPNVFVALMHANNEIGTLLPLKDVSFLCQKYQAHFLCDMVQTVGKFNLDFNKIPLSFATASAHKFHGPKGIGFAYCNSNYNLSANILGGGQERDKRAGTENLHGIVGMAKALEMAHERMETNINYVQSLKSYLVEKLKQNKQIRFNASSDTDGLYSILNIAIPLSNDTEMLLYKLDINGFAVSGGSACASGNIKNSHVLNELGVSNDFVSLRISLSPLNCITEIDAFVNFVNKF